MSWRSSGDDDPSFWDAVAATVTTPSSKTQCQRSPTTLADWFDAEFQSSPNNSNAQSYVDGGNKRPREEARPLPQYQQPPPYDTLPKSFSASISYISPTRSVQQPLRQPPLSPAVAVAAPLCSGHLEPKKLLESHSVNNPNRMFYICAHQGSEQCNNSFEWADQVAKRPKITNTAPLTPINPTATTTTSAATDNDATTPHAQSQPSSVTLAVECIDVAQFALTFTPFHKKGMELCKSFHGQFDSQRKHWIFPLAQYDAILAAFKHCKPLRVECSDEIPKPVRVFLNKEIPPLKLEDATLKRVLPPKIAGSLLPFQIEGVKFALQHEGKIIFGDEMGVGKSLQAIAVMHWYREKWPVLIVCPSSLRWNWQSELVKWLEDEHHNESDIEDMIDVISKSSQKSLILDRQRRGDTNFLTIISYDLMTKCADILASVGYGVCIVDESHAIKSNTTQRTKALVPIIKATKHALLLSGTPALNKPAELFTQISALRPDLFPSFMQFGRRYCAPSQTKWGLTYDGGAHLQELHLVLKRHLMIRRMKADVLPQLPPKRRQAVIVECDRATLKKSRSKGENVDEWFDRVLQDDLSNNSTNDPSVMRLFNMAAMAKSKAVIEYCLELLESVDKFLLFFHHRELGDFLGAELEKRDVSFIRIDGSTPGAARSELVSTFQHSPSHRIALLSITAASTGFTLTAASTVIFAELYWSPSLLLQAEDRVHRIGASAASINIQYMLGKGTVDEFIWPMLTKKLDLLSLTLNGFKQDQLGLDAHVQHEDSGDNWHDGQATLEQYLTAAPSVATASESGSPQF